MTAEALLERLEGVKRTAPGRWLARCPAHADRSPSLSIRELDDGRVLVHDYAGCDVHAVLSAVGLDFDALFPSRAIERGARERRPFPAADVLRAVAGELSIIVVIASDLRRGVAVAPTDYDRLRVAIERVQAARELALG